MPTVIETTVYTYAELSDSAKQRARDWFIGHGDCVHYDFVYDDAVTIAGILGIEIERRKDGNPAIYWRGFSSQGDGACFEGSYRYKLGALKAIRSYAPKDTELHRIAKALQDAQRTRFYRLRATCKHHGFYYHSGCMDVSVTDNEHPYADIGEAESNVRQALRDFADWIYRQLENEYEWQTSDENVAETIDANGYTFTENGKREG